VPSNQTAYAKKRRSSRIDKAIPVFVQGMNASHSPFREEVKTMTISCHGCTYQMRQQVLPGDVVFLDTGQPARGRTESLTRARVKWIQKIAATQDEAFDVAVELEVAGNIWGIASPPQDWFPVQAVKVIESPNPGRELRVMTRPEPQPIAGRTGEVPQISPSKKNEPAASLAPSFSELVAGLSEQIQVMASETAASTLAKEKARLVDEFRAKLQDEALTTLERVIAISKEELARRAVKELIDTLDATARTCYQAWMKKLEQDMENAKQRMAVQGNEVGQRIDSMATYALERLQRNLETTRNEAADRFVSRLRGQVTPLLEGAKAELQKLTDSQNIFRRDSHSVYEQFSKELENIAQARLTSARDELAKNSAAIMDQSHEQLLKLSETFERATRESLQSQVISSVDDAKKALHERTSEISTNFAADLEGFTRSYLDAISESIAQIPKKIAIPSRS